jgi:hypothetical protein
LLDFSPVLPCGSGDFVNLLFLWIEESYEALKKEFPSLEAECFMSKEVIIRDLIGRINRILST